jgi:hypothetical protein
MRLASLATSCCLLLATTAPTFAARTVPVDQPVTIRLELQQTTAVVLPEPVASVTVGMAPEQFSLDHDGPYLFLIALDPAVAGRLFVIGASGKLYLITFRVAAPADDIVSLAASQPPDRPPSATHAGRSLAQMLRALRTRTVLPGEQAVEMPAPTLPDAALTVVQTQAVAWGAMLGVTVTVQNVSPLRQVLDIRERPKDSTGVSGVQYVRTWVVPPRLTVKALAAEDELLEPGTQTRVFFLLEKRP